MESDALLKHLRHWLFSLKPDSRVPPERVLAERFGVSRAEIRKVLSKIEVEGLLRREVGRGTFVRPAQPAGSSADDLALRISPREAMEARLVLEPSMARLAALHATSQQLGELAELNDRMRSSQSWAIYEQLDYEFHERIARASGNKLLAELHHILNNVRRLAIWGQLDKRRHAPPEDYSSFVEHDEIIEAISNRQLSAAGEAMRRHLLTTSSRLFEDALETKGNDQVEGGFSATVLES